MPDKDIEVITPTQQSVAGEPVDTRLVRESPSGSDARYRLGLAVLSAALLLAIIVAAGAGAVHVPIKTIVSIMVNHSGLYHIPRTWPKSDEAIILLIRLPRVIAAALVGAALSLAGVLFQGLFRNPMADPYVIGASGGAALGATVGLTFCAGLSLWGFGATPPSQLLFAYACDLFFADPAWMPHPVKLFGRLAAWGEMAARSTARSPRTLKLAGVSIALTIPMLAGAGSWLLLEIVEKLSRVTEYIAVIYLAYTALSVRELDQVGKKVIDHLQRGEVAEARICLGMIVGRDTQDLDEPEILRAVIETLAENSCDGVVAPLFYLALGGAPAGLAYKAINTLDSMIGYKNDRYLHFGWAAARLDDVFNFVPARLAAGLAAAAAFILRLSWKESLRIVSRDASLQPSPNSGFPEAAFAGALGVRLGGINKYGGCESRKAYLGESKRAFTSALYPEVQRLLYLTSALALMLSMGISGLLFCAHL